MRSKSPKFEGLTPRQMAVLGQVVIGNDGGHHPKTLEVLVEKGYVVRSAQRLGGPFPITIWRYTVPPAVLLRWCAWCAAQVTEDSPDAP